jgi:hypothetical protein
MNPCSAAFCQIFDSIFRKYVLLDMLVDLLIRSSGLAHGQSEV